MFVVPWAILVSGFPLMIPEVPCGEAGQEEEVLPAGPFIKSFRALCVKKVKSRKV